MTMAASQAPNASASEACRVALAHERFDPVRRAVAARADAPRTPEAWFEFCAAYLNSPGCQTLLGDLKRQAPDAPVEAFAALNALAVAATRIDAKALPRSIKENFDEMCRDMAALEPHWVDHFDLASPRFYDITELCSLNRFLAGEVAFSYGERLPFNFVFRCHPAQLVSLLRQVAGPMRGAGPFLSLHFNYGRRNRLIVSQGEFERALWRLAKVLESDPAQTGIVSHAWFHSACVRDAFPRLAWMRDLFVAGGAYAIDLEPGHAEDICYNSAKRKELYDAGQFLPRHTLILWPRDDVLAWAASRPELADPGEAQIDVSRVGSRRSIASPRPQPCTRWNSPAHLWNGRAARQRYGAKYFAALLGAPSALAAMLAGWNAGWVWSLPAFLITAYSMVVLQYFVSE